MKIMISILGTLMLFIILIIGCSKDQQSDIVSDEPYNGKLEIIQAWQGDFPVNQIQHLPGGQKDKAIGYISDNISFSKMWKQFKPGQTYPDIDFKNNLVLFVRNTQFYNRISIGQIKLTDGVAEILAMETMSAMPIENHVALSLVVVQREGIKKIKVGEKIIIVR